MNLLLAITLVVTTCTNSEIDDRRAAVCRLTGGQPYVQDFSHCTLPPRTLNKAGTVLYPNAPASSLLNDADWPSSTCVSVRRYKGCAR